jgi:hypothetical protein
LYASLNKGVKGLVLPPVLVKVSVEAVEGVVSLSGPALQLLPPTSKARRAGQEKHEREREREEELRDLTKSN